MTTIHRPRSIALLFALAAFLAAPSPAQDWRPDPSAEVIPKGDGLRGERFRLLADFNGDGLVDMALSEDLADFGNAGGVFTLYLAGGDGRYRSLGQFFAHSQAVALERTGSGVRLWTYVRGSGSKGKLGYAVVGDSGLTAWQDIAIHPGDGGTDMGRALYDAVFGHSDLPVRVQKSATEAGTVRWGDAP